MKKYQKGSHSPAIVEYLKACTNNGKQPQIIRESICAYHIKFDENSYGSVSKYMLYPGFQIDPEDIRTHWVSFDSDARRDIVSTFWNKREWISADNEIIDFIIQNGNDDLWELCALAFLRHPDRDRMASFLINRLRHYRNNNEPLNYIQVLGYLKDKRAVPAIRPFYEKYRAALQLETVIGVPNDVVFGPIPYHAYFTACGALYNIEGTSEYEDDIRKYLDHPNEQVRYWAKYQLESNENN